MDTRVYENDEFFPKNEADQLFTVPELALVLPKKKNRDNIQVDKLKINKKIKRTNDTVTVNYFLYNKNLAFWRNTIMVDDSPGYSEYGSKFIERLLDFIRTT